ncbi:MAG: histidine kinase dimerization/phospho-acceptor domain-containing protein, partial [Mycobacteriales bacterium]
MVVAAGCVLLLTVALNVVLSRRLDAEAVNAVRNHAEATLATVTVQADGSLALAESNDAGLDTGAWVFSGTMQIEGAQGNAPLQDAVRRLAGTSGQLVHVDEPQPLLLASLAVRDKSGQVGTVVTAQQLAPYEASGRNVQEGSAALAILLLLLVYPLARALLGRALLPVAQMTSQARDWSETGAAQRFGSQERPGELSALAVTLDDLLDRLSAVLRREQQLSAEISHELRTPLAAIVAETELFESRPRRAAEARQAVRAVHANARRMEVILETLLASERATRSELLGRSLASEVLEAAAAAGADPRIQVTSPPDLVLGVDGPVVERILGPLVDNA